MNSRWRGKDNYDAIVADFPAGRMGPGLGWAAAQRPLKVYISAGAEYPKYRRLMTLEVNAAVEGAFLAGATEVLVSDSHGNAQNIDHELLDPRAICDSGLVPGPWHGARHRLELGCEDPIMTEILVLSCTKPGFSRACTTLDPPSDRVSRGG